MIRLGTKKNSYFTFVITVYIEKLIITKNTNTDYLNTIHVYLLSTAYLFSTDNCFLISLGTPDFKKSRRAFSLVGDNVTIFTTSTLGGDLDFLQNIGASFTSGGKNMFSHVGCSTI